VNNSKVTGHHAIIPTINISTADISALPEGEKNILKMIAVKLICASAPAHKYEAVKITAECSENLFTATGKSILFKYILDFLLIAAPFLRAKGGASSACVYYPGLKALMRLFSRSYSPSCSCIKAGLECLLNSIVTPQMPAIPTSV
ncbi:MAG: hypothetical protein II409_07075, partial [Clostridia bacterium]|nr:hypothetical protein [Clostridia bacterium]